MDLGVPQLWKLQPQSPKDQFPKDPSTTLHQSHFQGAKLAAGHHTTCHTALVFSWFSKRILFGWWESKIGDMTVICTHPLSSRFILAGGICTTQRRRNAWFSPIRNVRFLSARWVSWLGTYNRRSLWLWLMYYCGYNNNKPPMTGNGLYHL